MKKIKKNICTYHYKNLDDMIYSLLDIEQNILKLVILGHFLEISFYTCVTNITIIWCTVSEIQSETDRIFCHFGPLFALLPHPLPLMISKIKILKKQKKKKKKKIPGDIIPLYIHVYHKWRSYDICFLNYKKQQTEIFVILSHFFALSASW